MVTLYVKTGCPYCARVLSVLSALNVSAEQKNIADPSVAAELVGRGGKRQVPYLVDKKTGTEMYESEDIAAYLARAYGGGIAPGTAPKGSVCPVE